MNLTEKQEQVLKYLQKCNRAPTYRQIAEDCDIWVSGAHRIIHCLQERGFLEVMQARACGISLTKKGKEYGRKNTRKSH